MSSIARQDSFFTVSLPCRWTDDLLWNPLLETIPEKKSLVWALDLGFSAPYFSLEDEMLFHSLTLALKQFSQEVWSLYGQRSQGVLLYQGTLDFSSRFSWSEAQEENWRQKKETAPKTSEAHQKRLFCADAFAYYFQKLAHALPDEAPIFLHFDTQGCGSLAEVFQLSAKERFEPFLLSFSSQREEDSPWAVCLPLQEKCSEGILHQLNQLFSKIKKPFRIIEELFLTESWEGVDTIFVLSDSVTMQGKRKLRGFCSAGGFVVVEGEILGLPNEVSMKEFGAEGFEPPTYWSQTSRASQAALCPDR